jgi:acetylornithine deacetylase/succinyl-diaminopimelate desuccinylase-like protein
MRSSAILIWSAASFYAFAQSPAVEAAREWRKAHERAIVDEFVEFLAIPDVASDKANIRRNAELIKRNLEKRGIPARFLEVPDANPVVFGELKNPDAKMTFVLYAHYDGQPVTPADWKGGQPFKPVLRTASIEDGGQDIPLPPAGQPFNPEWRLFSRAASDDKAPIQMMLSALDALKAKGMKPSVNLKFVFEGEEEAGSMNLDRILAAHKDVLKSDAWLICDGPVDQSRRRQIVFGARGVQTVDLTIYGPRRELHSGHYGNWAPNPAMQMARLLASMKDDDGKVLIEGFYDDILPLSPADKKAIAEIPVNDEQLKKELWLGGVDGGGKTLTELLTLPSLNIRGIQSAHVGAGGANVVPSSATVSIDMRLVKGISREQALARLRRHMEKQGYFVADKEPDAATRMAHPKVIWMNPAKGGYVAVRTPMDLPVAQTLIRNVEAAFGKVIKRPNTGGSVPLYMIEQVLGSPTIQVPTVNHDNNQHSFNENIRIANLWEGIEMMAVLMTMN